MTARKKIIKTVTDVLVYGSIFLSLSAASTVGDENPEVLVNVVRNEK